MGTKIEIERGDEDTERGDEIKKLQKKKRFYRPKTPFTAKQNPILS